MVTLYRYATRTHRLLVDQVKLIEILRDRPCYFVDLLRRTYTNFHDVPYKCICVYFAAGILDVNLKVQSQ